MRAMIQLQAIQLLRGSRVLLEGADLTVHPGQKLGLIGANGSGKSSLFKLVLGELHEDVGSISIPKDWRLAHMAQEVGESTRNAVDYVIDGDAELRQLEARLEDAEGETLARLYERMEAVDGYTAMARAQKLLDGLGFQPGDDTKPVTAFSGGWRIRLNLARALMCRSDLLLLDEPTNHLDLDATVWLERWLQAYSGTLLIISHDRDFLDNVVGGIVHLEQQKLVAYSGNYSAFEIQRADRLSQQAQAFEKQQQRIAEIESFVRRFRAKATKAKQAQSRLKELDRMEQIAPAHVDTPFSFRFPKPDKLPQTLLSLSEAELGYEHENTLVNRVEFSVLASSRIGLLGHNGAGKSTLVKTLASSLDLLAGERSEAQHLKLGYYSQHQLETLDFEASPALHIQRISAKATEQEIRTFLGSFGFHGDRVFEVIEHFSGGEKARLALAILAWQKPNLLLLDEPTNHLDLEVRHALTLALQLYEGAIVIVSHDRHLLKNTVEQFYLVDSGSVTEFDGDLADYESWLSAKPGAQVEPPEGAPVPLSKEDKKERRQQAAAQRERLKPLHSAIKKLEKQMLVLQEKLAKTEEQLADTDLYQDKNKAKLQQLIVEQGNWKAELETLEMDWLEQSEALEQAQAET